LLSNPQSITVFRTHLSRQVSSKSCRYI